MWRAYWGTTFFRSTILRLCEVRPSQLDVPSGNARTHWWTHYCTGIDESFFESGLIARGKRTQGGKTNYFHHTTQPLRGKIKLKKNQATIYRCRGQCVITALGETTKTLLIGKMVSSRRFRITILENKIKSDYRTLSCAFRCNPQDNVSTFTTLDISHEARCGNSARDSVMHLDAGLRTQMGWVILLVIFTLRPCRGHPDDKRW